MCVVLDANTFGAFFDPKNKEHSKFVPVLKWVVTGRGKLVYGGGQYRNEMRAARRFLRLFANLERAGKLVHVADTEVDHQQEEVERLGGDGKCNDLHLIAVVRASGCRIICTNDRRAVPYLKDAKFYRKCVKRPKIYQSKRNAALLTDVNIADVCKPLAQLSKSQVAKLEISL